MGKFSIAHWLVVLGIVAIFFGPKRLPELGKGLGEMISNFKKGLRNGESANSQSDDVADAPKLSQSAVTDTQEDRAKEERTK